MPLPLQGFRSLIENGSDAISLIDRKGQILYASASAAKVFGYPPEELVGRNSLELIHQEDRARMSGTLPGLFAEPPGPVQWHARICRKDGSWSWVESTACNMLLDPEVQAIAIIHRDISARKAAEAKLKKEAEDLVLSNLRLEEFAYTVAHDLREPLRTITAFTQLLMERTELDAMSKQVAGFAIDAAARMSGLLDGLLSLASTGLSETARPVDLSGAVTEAIKNLGLALEESQARVTMGPLPVVDGNESHLVRIFQNLIGNAVKYRGPAPPEIHVAAVRQGKKWVIETSDNGIGIAPEDHDRIFGLFTRLHGRDIAGTGIGLAFCKKIVEEAGGRIWVKSSAGTGSTFFFTIAATGPAAVPVPSGGQVRLALSGSS